MTGRYRELMFTPEVKAAQEEHGSRTAYARLEGDMAPDALTIEEAAFIADRDSFYMASVGSTGWPYLQHRGGPRGFVRILDTRRIGFADLRGNRQYISLGNAAADDRVALFFMDYVNRRRLKLLGRMKSESLDADPDLAARLVDPSYKAKVERGLVITVEAYDWNCPQHITPRYTLDEISPTLVVLKDRIRELEAVAKQE